MAAISKMTSKCQATIPKEIREVLGLSGGDTVLFEVNGGQVTLRKLAPADVEYLRAVGRTLSEWTSREDEEAYGDL